MLAELRAARAAGDPATTGGAGSTTNAAQAGGTSNAVIGTPPQPPPGLLQFLQQFQSATGTTATDTTAAGTGNTVGSDITGILADLDSLVTQLQQGIGTTAASGTTATAETSSTAAAASAPQVQTGNDLALQYLGGWQGGAGGLLPFGA